MLWFNNVHISIDSFSLSLSSSLSRLEQLQLAIKCGHVEMVKKLLPQCKLNHLDNNMNSIFHYAALTSKEIINVSFIQPKCIFFEFEWFVTATLTNQYSMTDTLAINLNLICYTFSLSLSFSLWLISRHFRTLFMSHDGAFIRLQNRKTRGVTSTGISGAFAILTHNIDERFFLATPLQLIVTKSTENINNLNNEGYTPLHLSCQWDKPDCVKALLAAGADANIQSAKTKGPINNSINSKYTF